MADRVALGSGGQGRRQHEDRGQREPRGGQAGHLRAAAGPVDRGGLGQAARDAEPAEDPRADVPHSHREQLLARVDPGVLRGVEPGSAQALGKPHEGHRRPGEQHLPPVGQRDPGQRRCGQSLGHGADHPHAVGGQVEDVRGDQPDHQGDQRPRHLGGQLRAAEHQGQADHAHDHRLRVDVVQAREEVRDARTDVGRGRSGDAQDVGQLTEDHQDRQAQHEPCDDRLGQELRDPADVQRAGHDQHHAGCDRHGGGEGHRLGRAGWFEPRDEGSRSTARPWRPGPRSAAGRTRAGRRRPGRWAASRGPPAPAAPRCWRTRATAARPARPPPTRRSGRP